MNLFAMMETSGSAMQAERMRAEVVAANMANAETTRTSTGGPYHRQHVVFAADGGDPGFLDSLSEASGTPSSNGATALPGLNPNAGNVAAPGVRIAQVVEDTAPPLKRYDPGHPDAGPDGGDACIRSERLCRAGGEGHDLVGAGDCQVVA